MEKDYLKEKMEEHDRRLDKHDDKIEKLETNEVISKTRIDSLCKSLDDLTSTLKWLSGFLLSTTGLLIVYFIEQIIGGVLVGAFFALLLKGALITINYGKTKESLITDERARKIFDTALEDMRKGTRAVTVLNNTLGGTNSYLASKAEEILSKLKADHTSVVSKTVILDPTPIDEDTTQAVDVNCNTS